MGLQAARAVVPRMLLTFRWFSLDSGFGLANVLCGLDRQGWITVFAALLLALITLFTSYTHVDLLGAASVDLPQQAGIPCIVVALATAVAEAQLASNDRQESAAIRVGAADFARRESDRAAEERILAGEERNRAAQERERAARSEQRQARALRAGALVWLNPTPLNRRFLELVVAELAESVQP